MSMVKVDCAIIRGGTTKGIYLDQSRLPGDAVQRDRFILSLFGSPDTRQINGLGGADPLTSKVAIVAHSPNPEIDIDYTSGEVGIDEAVINYSTMCGNLASGAALYAVEHGLVNKVEPLTEVRIRNCNTGKRLTAYIPIVNGNYVMSLSESVDGVAGYGADLNLAFHDPAGSITGELLPTGRPQNEVVVDGETVPCSIVDCGTLYGFLDASCFGLSGTESPRALDNDESFKNKIEVIREQIADLISGTQGISYTARQVKIAVVASSSQGGWAAPGEPVALTARVINRYKTHKAYPVTGAICLNAAAAIHGTLVQRMAGQSEGMCAIRIMHPTGAISVHSRFEQQGDYCQIRETKVSRSARVLMCGTAYAWLD